MENLDLTQLPSLDAINAELARQDFLEFVTFTWPRYEVNWHHKAIADQLDAFARGEIKRLMLFVPPQHGKSQLSSRHLPAYLMGRHPDRKLAICSYSDGLAGEFSMDAQRIMEGEEFAMVFPEVKIPKKGGHSDYKRNADICQIIGRKGSIKSVGVGNGLTGNTVDFAIIDDPIKDRLDANSQTYRDRLWDWYVDVLQTRLDNNAQVLLLLTRWHEDDLAGRLLNLDEEKFRETGRRDWTVIRYPALKEADYTAPDDPREVGEALWPNKHSAENILAQRKRSEQTFNSLYQQRPSSPEGNLLKVTEMGVITMAELTDKLRGRRPVWDFKVDGAYTDKSQNDASAIYASAMVDNDVYIRKCVSVRMVFDDLLAFLRDFLPKHGYTRRSKVKVEPKANGLSIIQSMRRHTKLNVMAYKWPKDDDGNRMDRQDKVERANAIAPFITAGRVILVEDGTGWTKNFKEQCAAFPNASHDDEVDCLVMDMAERYFDRSGNVRIVKEN